MRKLPIPLGSPSFRGNLKTIGHCCALLDMACQFIEIIWIMLLEDLEKLNLIRFAIAKNDIS